MTYKATLSEVVLRTLDFDRLSAFYDALLDGPRVRDITPAQRGGGADAPSRMRFIPLDPQRSFGGDTLAIFECEGRDTASPGQHARGLHHFQLKLPDLATLFATYERMRAKDVLPAKAQNHGLSTSLYYLDPDRNKVEINVRNFVTVEEEERYAATPEFAQNPGGFEIDPQAILRSHAAGAALDKLVWEAM